MSAEREVAEVFATSGVARQRSQSDAQVRASSRSFSGKQRGELRPSESISSKISRSVFDSPRSPNSRNDDDEPSTQDDGAVATIHPAVFEGASATISDLYNKGVKITYERAAEILSKYQKASATAERHFPGARDGKIILRQAKNVLLAEGFNKENTLFAQSVCADEINHDVDDITHLFSSYLGEVFHLGGLAGIPFTGKTGFAAFASHLPDDGHLFILFAPHVGISDSLVVGKYTRSGQIFEGHACGAAIGALNYCTACKPIPDAAALGAAPLDYQMNFIISKLSEHVEAIVSLESGDDQQAALVHRMYLICKEFLDGIVDVNITDLHGNPVKIAILGGIQINMPRPMADFFQPLLFEIREKGKPNLDLLEKTFYPDPSGPMVTPRRETFA